VIACNAGDYLQLTAYVAEAGRTLQRGSAYNFMSVVQVGNLSSVSAPTSTMCAKAYRNASLSFPSGAWTKIPFDSTAYDTSGLVQLSNGRIQISQAGYYQVNTSVTISWPASTLATWYVGIYKNGNQLDYTLQRLTADTNNTAVVADVVQCSAGDYLELWVWASFAGSTYSGGQASNFMSVSLQTSLPGAVGPTTPARAYRNAAYTVPGGGAVVPLDTIAFDPGGNFSTASSRYTAPASGYYQIDGVVGASSTGSQLQAQIWKNGSQVSSNFGASAGGGTSVSDVVYLNVGDYVDLRTYLPTGTVALSTGLSFTYMSVVQVGNQMATPASTACAKAFRTAAYTAAAGFNKVPLDTIAYDTSGMVQIGNGRIVCPVAGYYQAAGMVELGVSSSGQRLIVAIFKNGNEVARGNGSTLNVASGSQDYNVSDVVQCAAGDYLELWTYSSAGTAAMGGNTSVFNYLSVALLTPLSGTAGPTTVARAYRNAAYTLPGNGWQKIPIDKVDFDPAANISTANGRYTAPATGYYQVNGEVALGPTTGNISVMVHSALYVNGNYKTTGTVVSNSDNNGYMRASVSDILSLNAGDYVELWCYSLIAYPLVVGPSYNYLAVSQVGNSMNFKAASGDLTGNYPNPTVSTVKGGKVPVAQTDPAGGDLAGNYPNPTLAPATLTKFLQLLGTSQPLKIQIIPSVSVAFPANDGSGNSAGTINYPTPFPTANLAFIMGYFWPLGHWNFYLKNIATQGLGSAVVYTNQGGGAQNMNLSGLAIGY
jgi:hypothetical protein